MIKLKRHQIAVEPIYDSDYYNPVSQLIVIPQQAKERCDQGIVKYIGSEVKETQVGEHVIFSGYTGTTVAIDKELLIVMHEDFIKARIDIDNYPLDGLYYKGKIDSAKLDIEITNILYNTAQAPLAVRVDNLMKLFALFMADSMIPAQYEQTFPLISQAYNRYVAEHINVKVEEFKTQRDAVDHRSR